MNLVSVSTCKKYCFLIISFEISRKFKRHIHCINKEMCPDCEYFKFFEFRTILMMTQQQQHNTHIYQNTINRLKRLNLFTKKKKYCLLSKTHIFKTILTPRLIFNLYTCMSGVKNNVTLYMYIPCNCRQNGTRECS